MCYLDVEGAPTWHPGGDVEHQPLEWCWGCVKLMKEGHYKRWLEGVKKADCAAVMRRCIGKGTPMTLADAIDGLSQPVGGFGEIVSHDGKLKETGKLNGSQDTEEARQEFGNMLKEKLDLFEAVEAAEKRTQI